MPTATILDLARDENVPLETLAELLGQSETWTAGLIDAVLGDMDWSDMFDANTPQSEIEQYIDGRDAGRELLAEEADAAAAAAWDEAHAQHAAELAQQAELLPVYGDDNCPF